jgi:TonB family protein
MVDVLVLSTDLVLFDAIRSAIGERNPVWRARSAEESVDLLLTGRCGVLLVDMAAVSGTPATLISQIAEQFPDLVIVVAGRREDEALLAQLISSGCVYRFMHKPITAKRAGMFLQAAVRRHAELRDASVRAPLIPLAAVLPGRFDPRKWLFVGAGVLIFVAILWLAGGGPRDVAMPAADEPTDPAPAAASAPSTPLADPVLSRARAAYAAGRHESPPGRNALDLYAAVLLSKPDQPEAREGLESTVAHVADAARAAVARGDADEAARLLARLQDVAPALPAVAALDAELSPAPEPTMASARDATMAPAQDPTMAPSRGGRPSRSSGIALSAGLPAPTPATATPTYSSMPDTPARGTGLPGPVTRLPGPVTKLPRTSPTQAPEPKVSPSRTVQADPLAPRIANADELRLRELALQQAAANLRNRRGTAPVAAATTAPAAPAYAAPEARVARPDAAAPAADELGRVRVVDPVYPPQAMRDGVEGWVELDFTITETGSVRDIVVVGSQPSGVFDAAATEALSGWKYRPRIANGRPIAHRSNVTMRFDVEG